MSNNKQSSVEFFLYGMASLLGEFENKSLPQEKIMALFEQAKAMEKKRLMDAFNEGQEYEYQYHVNSTPKFDAETWYNETYGGKNETIHRRTSN